MKIIKIIDLLNKIANGEEVPTIIKYDGYIWKLREDLNDYWSDEEFLFLKGFDNYNINAKDFLNDEVEIIEEETKVEQRFTGCKWFADGKEVMSMDYSLEEDKKIEKLEGTLLEERNDSNLDQKILCCLANKINELIDEINKSKEEK